MDHLKSARGPHVGQHGYRVSSKKLILEPLLKAVTSPRFKSCHPCQVGYGLWQHHYDNDNDDNDTDGKRYYNYYDDGNDDDDD